MSSSITVPATINPADSLEGWLTKQEAAVRLGKSTKSIEAYVAEGKLEQRLLPQINRPARAMISPESIQKFLEARATPAPRTAIGSTFQNHPEPPYQKLAEVLQLLASRPHHWPHVLTEEQAVAYSGYGIGYLQAAVKWRKVGPRGAKVCRRMDLDALVTAFLSEG